MLIRRRNFDIPPLIKNELGTAINPMLKGVTPYLLTFDEISGDPSITIPASSSLPRNMSNDKAGIAVLNKISGSNSSGVNYLLEITHTGLGKKLMNAPIHSGTLVGTRRKPHPLPSELILDAGHGLSFRITNINVSTATQLWLGMWGSRYYLDSHKKAFGLIASVRHIPYFYTTDTAITIPASGTATGYFTVDANSDFFLKSITQTSTGTFTASISGSSVGRDWSNSKMYSGLLGGDHQDIWNFEPEIPIERGSTIKIDFVDLSGASNDVYITFAGTHYYVN